jgi:CDP-diacylglycerol--glycerol-3-phosphate 3-phosphatidyltransferase
VFELNLPNALTVLRMLLVPVLVTALLSEGPSGDALAAAVFVVASFTDALDGYIARRRRIETAFGKLMDPLADKLLVTATLVALVSLDRLAAWVAMVIIARELAVTGLRQVALEQGHVIGASSWGKLKTVAQILMVLCLIAFDGSPVWIDAIVYVTVVITVLSGADYFFGLHRLLTRAREAAAEGRHAHATAGSGAGSDPAAGPAPQAWPSSQPRMETRSGESSPVASSARRSPSNP